MSIPDFQSIMLPFLKFTADNKEHSRKDVIEHLTDSFSVSDADLQKRLASGPQPVFYNRVGWANTYLKKQD